MRLAENLRCLHNFRKGEFYSYLKSAERTDVSGSEKSVEHVGWMGESLHGRPGFLSFTGAESLPLLIIIHQEAYFPEKSLYQNSQRARHSKLQKEWEVVITPTTCRLYQYVSKPVPGGPLQSCGAHVQPWLLWIGLPEGLCLL